jgi:hypothetical protein
MWHLPAAEELLRVALLQIDAALLRRPYPNSIASATHLSETLVQVFSSTLKLSGVYLTVLTFCSEEINNLADRICHCYEVSANLGRSFACELPELSGLFAGFAQIVRSQSGGNSTQVGRFGQRAAKSRLTVTTCSKQGAQHEAQREQNQ